MTREPVDIDRTPEFSHRIKAEEVPNGGKTYKLAASEAQRAALAERLELASLDKLEGAVTLRPLAGGPMLVATGALSAAFAQRCVVTLELLPGTLEERFAVEYGPPEPESLQETEREFTLEDPDPPEAFVDGEVDLGELLAQQLALALDPHPRKPGVDLDQALESAPAARSAAVERGAPAGPFAELAKLKKKGEG
ncbi:MAG: YceD family protein [Nitratireductor sp.]